jgi:hypothetical protein
MFPAIGRGTSAKKRVFGCQYIFILTFTTISDIFIPRLLSAMHLSQITPQEHTRRLPPGSAVSFQATDNSERTGGRDYFVWTV